MEEKIAVLELHGGHTCRRWQRKPRRFTVLSKESRYLHTNNLVAHHEGSEQSMHLADDRVAPVLRHAREGDGSDAAMGVVGAHLDLTHDASFHERGEDLREYASGGIPPKLRLKHLANASEWHRVDRDNLHWNSGALGRALADPDFKLARCSDGPWLYLYVGHGQFAGISVGLTDHRGQADGRMLEEDVLNRTRIDIVAATDHNVLGAAGDPEKAVLVQTPELTHSPSINAPLLCASLR